MTIRIGVGVITGQVLPGSGRRFADEYRETLELVRAAEQLGFESAWVSEHHGAGDGYMSSLLPTLAAMAGVTEKMALGTAVMLTPFHHPLRLAEDAATVDLISGGRLVLGLGLGWRDEEFRMFGIPRRERVLRTEETIEILRLAWTGQRFSFQGKAFQLDRVQVTPTPAQPAGPSIYLGGTVEPAIVRAGRLADGYIRDPADRLLSIGVEGDLHSGAGGDAEQALRDVAMAETAAVAAGRDAGAFGFAQMQSVYVGSEGGAWERIRQTVEHQVGCYGGWEAGGDTPGRGFELAPPSDDILRRLTPCGAPEMVAEHLTPIVQAFADRPRFDLILRFHFPGMALATALRSMELFAERVIPTLRQLVRPGTQTP